MITLCKYTSKNVFILKSYLVSSLNWSVTDATVDAERLCNSSSSPLEVNTTQDHVKNTFYNETSIVAYK